MSNAKYIRAGLLRRGMPEHIADGFIENFKDESGLNPGINEAKPLVPGSRGGFGLYQLTGPRRRGYEAYASQKGAALADIDTQLDYLMTELEGPESAAAKDIYGAKDTAGAAQAIVNKFLRPAEEHRSSRTAKYAALGGPAPVRMADSGATMTDATTNVPNERMPSSSAAPVGASPTTQAAGPMVQIGAEKSNKLNEAMVANAMRQGGNARNGWDAVGALAQVWAGSSEMKENDASNASELQKAYAEANLSPQEAMVAQLGGGRDDLAGVLASRMDREAQQAQLADQRRYQQSVVADERQYEGGIRQEDRQFQQQDAATTRENGIADYRTKQEIDQEFAPAAKPPASVQEYQFAQQQGFKGSYADWEQQNRRAGATTINTGDASGTGAFYKTADEARAKSFIDIANSGTAAQRRMLQVDQLEGLLANVPTGGTAALKQYAGEWGINTEGLDDIQAAAALINEMVPSQRPPGSGTMSDADLALFKASLPRIINQPGGNELVIQTMRGIANYDQALGQVANRVLNREIDPAQGQQLMSGIENPLARFRDAAGGVQPSEQSAGQAPEAGQVARPTSDAEYQALPSGAIFVDPDDGQTYRKP